MLNTNYMQLMFPVSSLLPEMGTVWRCRLTLNPNLANYGITAAAAALMTAATLVAAAGPVPLMAAPLQRAKEPPLSGPKRPPAPPPPARGARRAKASCGRKGEEAQRSMRHGRTWMLSCWSSAAPTPQSSTLLR